MVPGDAREIQRIYFFYERRNSGRCYNTLHVASSCFESKTLPCGLKQHLSATINVVRYIKGRALNHRIFCSLCDEIRTVHNVLIYHTDMRWLSKGRMLPNVFELRNEILQFLAKQNNDDLFKAFKNRSTILGIAYLSDIFSHINDVNLSLQGFSKNIITANEKITSFVAKLKLWGRRIESMNFANFPTLDSIITEDEKIRILPEIKVHLYNLGASFDSYFSAGKISRLDRWILNPFVYDINQIDDDNILKEDLIEIKTNARSEMEFEEYYFEQF